MKDVFIKQYLCLHLIIQKNVLIDRCYILLRISLAQFLPKDGDLLMPIWIDC